jgi:hypothetical protein
MELAMVDAKAGSRKTVARKTTNQRRKPAASEASSNRWSQRVTRKSDALDLKRGVFTLTDSKKIAASTVATTRMTLRGHFLSGRSVRIFAKGSARPRGSRPAARSQ